jgi:prephenate dehydratase
VRRTAAIAGRRAAEIYGLEVLAEGIETNLYNYTKFLLLSTTPAPRQPDSKTSIVFTTENIPGALYKALGALATRSLNLTKLESRPRREVPWEYVFYVDFEGHQDDPEAAAALSDLARVCVFHRVLGSYPKSPNHSLRSGSGQASGLP